MLKLNTLIIVLNTFFSATVIGAMLHRQTNLLRTKIFFYLH